MRRRGSIRKINPYETHSFAAAIIAGVSAAATVASTAYSLSQSGTAGDAANTQTQYTQMGIDELKAALGPSMARLAKAQGWSDKYLKQQMDRALKDLQPYAKAGKRGLAALQSRLGLAGDPNDPNFGSLMKQYVDKFEGQISDVSKRQYDDKYTAGILATAADKFDRADFEADPGYEFRRTEGQRGVEQSSAARGSLLSGASLKELDRFNQGTASDEFNRAHGRWADVRDTSLNAQTDARGFDYGVFGDQKSGELNSLVNQRDFDYGNFEGNRGFQYNALSNLSEAGQRAASERAALRQHFGGARTQNALATATQQGQWQQGTAAGIANYLDQTGDAQAAGQLAGAQAQNQAFQGGANALIAGAQYYGDGYGGQSGSGQRRWGGWNAPEWYRQNRGVPV